MRLEPSPVPPLAVGAAAVMASGEEFAPDDVGILPGESVTSRFADGPHDVTSDDEAATGGDVPTSPAETEATRTVPGEGDYDYECTLHPGMRGQVRVRS